MADASYTYQANVPGHGAPVSCRFKSPNLTRPRASCVSDTKARTERKGRRSLDLPCEGEGAAIALGGSRARLASRLRDPGGLRSEVHRWTSMAGVGDGCCHPGLRTKSRAPERPCGVGWTSPGVPRRRGGAPGLGRPRLGVECEPSRSSNQPLLRPAKAAPTQTLEQKLWQAADKLRNNMDAAEYKHVVLGLIFLKYISDAFEEQARRAGRRQAADEGADPEDRDEYTADNVFWVPQEARWSYLQAQRQAARRSASSSTTRWSPSSATTPRSRACCPRTTPARRSTSSAWAS